MARHFTGLRGYGADKPRTTLERRMIAFTVIGDTVSFVQMWSLWGTLRAWLAWLDYEGRWMLTHFAWDDTYSAPPMSEHPRFVSAKDLRFARWDWICRRIDRIGDPPYLLAVVTQAGEPLEMYMPAPLAVKAKIVSQADATATLNAFANRPKPCPPDSFFIRQDVLQDRANEIAAKDAQKIEDHERSAACTTALVKQGVPEWLASWWCEASVLKIALTAVAAVGTLALLPTVVRSFRAPRPSPPPPPALP